MMEKRKQLTFNQRNKIEEMLNQREKMLNEQMMAMMSGVASQSKPAEAVQATTE